MGYNKDMKITDKIKKFFFKDAHYTECFCPICKHEIFNDEQSVFYEGGTFTNIICSKCGTQSTWDLDAPVPLYHIEK
jgi:hypothetical protein